MDFPTAEQHYHWYTEQFQQGKMTAEQYSAAIDQIRVTDSHGRLWMLQKGSGKWFVSQNNQWIAAMPEIPGKSQNPSGTHRKQMPKWILPATLSVALLCCIGMFIVGGSMVYNRSGKLPILGDLIPGQSTKTSEYSFNELETLEISAGSNQQIDSNGTTLDIPTGSLPENSQATLVVSQPNPDLAKIVADAFQTEAVFYQLVAQGENDGTGPGTLTAPAKKNLALLVETIDDRYLAFTQVPILDGVIQVQVPIGSASSEDADESISFRGNRRFAILQFDPPEATQYGYRLAKLLPAPDPRSCGIDIQIASYSYMSKPTEKVASFCRKNTAGTIQVMVYPESTPKITAQMIDPVVDRIEAIMAVYQSKGLTAASLKDAWMRRVQVVIEAGSGDPYYSSVNGVVHIPEDSLGSTYTKNLNYELAHELAHWVQDEAYNFTSSYWANKTGVSSEAKWWLEVAAENMVFLYDPNYIEQNLTAFGMTTPATSDTPFQYSPNQWNDQLYLHAQLVKLFMCSNEYACPVSEEEFIKAINTGDYPYNESALAKVKENLSDYAIYLLGKPVISANSTILANGSITKGTGYGEFIQVVNNGKGENEYKKTGYKPQIEQITADGITKIKVAASIQKFGVYPLTLTSPTKEGQFGFPVEIVVESGTPFYYTFDDGTEKYHDGSTKITLGPLHGMLGYRKIRIVAFATDQVRNFNAMVQPLDLTGDWLIFSSGLTGQNYSCADEADAEVTIDYEELAKFSAIYTTLPAAVAGVYTPDPGGQGYTWAAQPGADLSFGSDVQLEIIGSMLLGSDTLRVQSKLVIPQQSQSSDGTIYLLSGMPLIGIVLVAMFRKKTRLAYGAIILCGAILLTGCFAFGGFYGTISTDTALTQFEPVNGQTIQSIADSLNSETVSNEEDAAAIPTDFGNIPAKYIFKGNTTAQVELHILSAEGEEQTSESVCSGTVSYNVVAVFVEDGKITSLGDQ